MLAQFMPRPDAVTEVHDDRSTGRSSGGIRVQ